MQVVYSPVHLAHDITHETYMGVAVPANEVAERAERIRTALEADGGFSLEGPTEHGEGPDGETGVVTARPDAWGDVILARKETPTSYHLSVVIDDALQGVTHVVRGQDLLDALGLAALDHHVGELLHDLLGRCGGHEHA